jgi:hypothetical protein
MKAYVEFSVAEPEPHHLVGAGAETQCGSDSAPTAPCTRMMLNMVRN